MRVQVPQREEEKPASVGAISTIEAQGRAWPPGHTVIHAEREQVRIEPGGRPTVHRPDGTRYMIERWSLTLRLRS
jgi:hypothetical protein